MAEDVKWIKVKVGMFDGGSLKRIRNAKIGGESYRDKLTAMWFELLDFAAKVNENGALLCDLYDVPFTDLDDLAMMVDRDPDEVKLCMQYFVKAGMVEITGDVYSVANWAKYQNEDKLSEIREKKRIAQAKWRAKNKGLLPEGEQETTENGRFSVESTSILPSYSYSLSTSISDREDKEGCGEEKERGKKGSGKGKKPIKQPDFDFTTTNFSPALIQAVESWLQYKTERRDEYKPTGLQSLMTQIQKNAAQHGEQAVIDLIGECMAQNYKGIIFDKLKNQNGGRHNEPGKSISGGRRYGTTV